MRMFAARAGGLGITTAPSDLSDLSDLSDKAWLEPARGCVG